MMIALRAVSRCAVRAAAVAPSRSRSLTTSAVRFAAPAAAASSEDIPTRLDEFGNRWADYRPEILRTLDATRNSDGDLVGQFQGEQVIFPDLDNTLEWCLTTPVDLHLFEEAPIIKMWEEETQDRVPVANKEEWQKNRATVQAELAKQQQQQQQQQQQ